MRRPALIGCAGRPDRNRLQKGMDPIYNRLKKRSRHLISQLPLSDFYKDFSWAGAHSSEILSTDVIVSELRDFISETIDNDFGHGMNHSVKVTLDAGALIFVEGKAAGFTERVIRRQLTLVQCAALLHDIKRKEKDHSLYGAKYAEKILKAYTLSPVEIRDVSLAIQNHEAFKLPVETIGRTGRLLSDCLYDADKFRWGPDTFADTLWDMVAYNHTPVAEFVASFPRGMAYLKKIRTTFRSATGKIYGPRFIDQGLIVGNELYRMMKTEFGL